MTDWNPADTPNFSRDEMACKCGCGRADMDASFMGRLQALRTAHGAPLKVNSGFRCPEYNERLGGGPEHVLGKAADLGVSGSSARRLLSLAVGSFPRIGVSQRGPHHSRFIHLGTAEPGEVNGASPWLWSY